ncbi:MAG: 50S ribosomal protein L11 methyltransferase, partial [Thermoleophilia bacterium]|nr:50S ribosomal protein L11 methyltransferase [Thermoleophilia bacterium]
GEPPSFEEVLAALPAELRASGRVQIETRDVSRDWVDGWRDHFGPIVIGGVRVRPPWEAALEGAALVDVVINPGLGFGTGLHATTRGTLQLLQRVTGGRVAQARPLGPVVDAGTGSGILAIAAAKLGWGPVFAFDNDPVALISARENVDANGVQGVVEIHQADIEEASPAWFAGATVLANMTLAPVTALLRRLVSLGGSWGSGVETVALPVRVVVSGILAGTQEVKLLGEARLHGLAPGERIYEDEWVSMELAPAAGGRAVGDGAGDGVAGGARLRGA